MNIFIPGSLQGNLDAGKKLPVLLFLHGGDYSYGSADGGGTFDTFWYDGIVLGSYGEFIYASVNYRKW
jgi:carboxylesterase type B